MLHIRLTPSTSRSELQGWHEQLAAGDGAPAALTLTDDLRPLTPGQHSAWMQLVLTWGQDVHGRTLFLTPEAVRRIVVGEPLSDVEVFAVLLAETVMSGDDDVTAAVQAPALRVLAERRVLTAHAGDGNGHSSSVLLADHTFTNRTSPDLHALWDGEEAVEETARSLYHDVWPEEPRDARAPAPRLRKPLAEAGEVAVPTGAPTHLTRTVYPAGHPHTDGEPFTSLGARAPRARGIALELATKVRVREKPVHDEVGEILFELVQNTEWHAAQWAGGRTGANCRAVTFREFAYEGRDLGAAAQFDEKFARYVFDVARRVEEQRKVRVTRVVLGSVTVIDSGVGLARSVALSKDEEHLLSKDTEVGYLIAALSKNLKRRRADLGNIGLARVQQCLTNINGFMSIRTGSVEILRNFVALPFEPLEDGKKPSKASLVLDWIAGNEEDFVVGPRLGTAVTVVYPVDFEVAS